MALNFDPIFLNDIIKKRKEIVEKLSMRKTTTNANSTNNNMRTSSDSSFSQAYSITDPEQTELLNRMFKEIKNHIMNKLYDKLYPTEADLNDIKIY